MQKEYWLDRWERQDIGFHQNEINPYLSQFWPRLQLAPGSTVLVLPAAKAAICFGCTNKDIQFWVSN